MLQLFKYPAHSHSPLACSNLLPRCGFKEQVAKALEKGYTIESYRKSYIPLLDIYRFTRECKRAPECIKNRIMEYKTTHPTMFEDLGHLEKNC